MKFNGYISYLYTYIKLVMYVYKVGSCGGVYIPFLYTLLIHPPTYCGHTIILTHIIFYLHKFIKFINFLNKSSNFKINLKKIHVFIKRIIKYLNKFIFLYFKSLNKK